MAKITVETEIDATIDRVWSVVSDLDNEPKFWKGTKTVKNISEEDGGNTINREITIAFRDQVCHQQVRVNPEEKRIVAKFTKGIISGEKTMTLVSKDSKTVFYTEWDINLTGVMGIFTGMIKKHIKNGTQLAMASIKEEIER